MSESKATGEHPICTGGIRNHLGRTRSRPLLPWDSLLRAAGIWFKSTDLGCCICAAGTTDALTCTTAGLGILAAFCESPEARRGIVWWETFEVLA